MLTCSNLGHNGLRNQLGRFAALEALSLKHGYDFVVPQRKFPRPKHQHGTLKDFFELDCKFSDEIAKGRNYVQTKADLFTFDKDFYENCEDNTNIEGVFQSAGWTNEFRDEIKASLQFKDSVKVPKLTEHECISLHIRRTDFIGHRDVMDLSFIKEALSRFDDSLPVVVFSDDIEWGKQNLTGRDFLFSEGRNAGEDLYLMSECDYHILSVGSSFSWWGAWLSEGYSKKAVSRFNPWIHGLSGEELRLEHWESI